MIQSTTTTTTTTTANGGDTTTTTNGGAPLIAVNATPFMTSMVTPTNNHFVAPRMNQVMPRDISEIDVHAALDQKE